MADPLQQIAAEHNAQIHSKSNTTDTPLLNELDDLDNKILIHVSPNAQPQKQKRKRHSRPHSQSTISRKTQSAKPSSLKTPQSTRASRMNGAHSTLSVENGGTLSVSDQESESKESTPLPLTSHHSWERTVLLGMFGNERVLCGKLHNESAMLHCGCSYVLSEEQQVQGELHLTNFLLYFVAKRAGSIPGGEHHLALPIASIAKISEREQRSSSVTEIVVLDRLYRPTRFRFAADKQMNYLSPDKVLQMLRALTFPNRMIDLFAFEYFKRHPSHERLKHALALKTKLKQKHKSNARDASASIVLASPRRDTQEDVHVNADAEGQSETKTETETEVETKEVTESTDIWDWDLYDAEREYNRMGVYRTNGSSEADAPKEQSSMKRHRQYTSGRVPASSSSASYSRYRFTAVNAGFEICDSYPELLVVPSSITDWELQQVARFRRLGRIPILSWKARDSDVALFRCSQPKVAMASNRSRADEHLMQSIAEANTARDAHTLYIMDARPKLNARVNKMRGGGFENTNFYKNSSLVFLNIENIHIMRKSRKALASLIHSHSNLRGSKDKEWLQALGSSEWLCHIRELLKGTYTMTRVLTKAKCSICCHCSDGWDRTSQLCCLVQLCLDPYYRTMKGFLILIEKEWLSVGHQFDKRCGHRKDDAFEEDERSPIFEQFIECVWQLTEQHPLRFEFSEDFLMCILDHLYSCKYGTFLCNKVKERQEHKLRERTLSLWTHLQNCADAEHFVNPYYTPSDKQLTPKYSLKVLRFWKSWHLRHCPEHIMRAKPTYSESGAAQIRELYQQLQKQNAQLRAEVARLTADKSRHDSASATPEPTAAATATSATSAQETAKPSKKSAHRPPADLLQDSQFD